jgi:hypothetical protein
LFLQLVWRILRPGGVFLFREHDGRPDLLPMVDVAHSVFNCLTGVTLEDEANEIRAFRPIAEWRKILTSFGFLVFLLAIFIDCCSFEGHAVVWSTRHRFH